jgi:hypothetical protein
MTRKRAKPASRKWSGAATDARSRANAIFLASAYPAECYHSRRSAAIRGMSAYCAFAIGSANDGLGVTGRSTMPG